MKRHTLLYIAACLPIAAQAADFAAWTHRQKIQVTQSGLTRLELEPGLLDQCTVLNDLRLVSPAGVETAFTLLMPEPSSRSLKDTINFKQTLIGQTTRLEFQVADSKLSREVLLETSAGHFIKAADLEGSIDGVNWQSLAKGELLFRQNGAEKLSFALEPSERSYFRITINDERSEPVVFKGARVLVEKAQPPTLPMAVTIRSRSEAGGVSKLTLDLGAANLILGTLRLRTAEPLFQRRVSVLGTSRMLFRLQYEGHSGEELEIPLQTLAGSREVELLIQNGDSPPLVVDGIEGTRHALPLLFQANAAGEWYLFAGNGQASAPKYDIAALSGQLRGAAASSAMAAAVEANPAYSKDATAPDLGNAGSVLDVSAWGCRRAIEVKEPGVLQVELPPEVITQAARDLHDLRVMREGRQLPYLVVQDGTSKEVAVSLEERPDEKRPTWSKWAIKLPHAGFPVEEMELESSTVLFEREMRVFETRQTERGTAEVTLGSATWLRRPGQTAAKFRIMLHEKPKSDLIYLTTDNGANALLVISAAWVTHTLVHVLFRVSDAVPVQLYYHHAKAVYPRYDVQMVRREFESATKVVAALGEEEQLSGFKGTPVASKQGGPWLWAALALVVVGLLWVVARMLPKAGIDTVPPH